MPIRLFNTNRKTNFSHHLNCFNIKPSDIATYKYIKPRVGIFKLSKF